MSERDSYKPGEFCWVDLSTTDVAAAVSFYGDVVGWEHEDAGDGTEGYGFFTYEGKQAAGIGPTMSDDQPPAWMSYVTVEDADASAAKVTDAGGTVAVGPMDLPSGAGRMAVCQDLEGAFFAIYQPGNNHGAELVNVPGTWTWTLLVSRDLDKAKQFYADVFGWKAEAPEEAPDFMNFQAEGQRWEEGVAGLIGSAEMPGDIPPHWQVYFLVPDIDDAVDKVESGGGSKLFGPQEVPVGSFAVFTDPQGASFALMEGNYPEPR